VGERQKVWGWEERVRVMVKKKGRVKAGKRGQ
jgi:hypothetical protein